MAAKTFPTEDGQHKIAITISARASNPGKSANILSGLSLTIISFYVFQT